MRSPMAMRELSRLLRQDAPEELLRRQLPLLIKRYGRNRRDRRAESLSSLPVITANNQPLTVEQQAVINQVLEDFQVNENAGECDQFDPAIAVDSSGNFMVVWEDYRSANSDIYAQCYTSRGVAQGTNFRVNDDSGYSDQVSPSIAVGRGGNFVVVWTDYRNGDSDIYAQRYNSSGEAQGANFQVNEDSRYLMTFEPAITADAEGNFVVVWRHEWYFPGASGTDANIYGQRYNSSGEAQGANFRVNDGLSGSQSYPAIAVDGGGNFVVVWKDEGDGMNPHGIYAQRYTSSGAKQSANFRVNDDSGFSYKFCPAIAVDAGGNFMVAWVDSRKGNYKNCDIYAQRYNSSGIAQGINFQVNDISGSVDFLSGPSVSLDSGGNFLVVWHDYRNGDPDIYAQRYSSNGAKQDANFRVNDDSGSCFQLHPAVSGDISGNVLVVWEDERNLDSDIYAQRYTSSGAKQGANFRVNDDSSSSWQWYPAIAADPSGNFVVVWEDYRNGDPDIYAQLFDSQGQRIGSNYRVNNDTGKKKQMRPDVKFVDGHIYYTWEDTRIEGQGYDIFARVDRFSTSAIPSADRIERVPTKYVLYPNYPNPFNMATTISFGLPEPAHVQVQIFDVNGRKVKRLVDQVCGAGVHSVVWNGTDEADRKVSSGIYICRFSAGKVVLNRKLILVK